MGEAKATANAAHGVNYVVSQLKTCWAFVCLSLLFEDLWRELKTGHELRLAAAPEGYGR
jgi:hypothetical protein